MLPLQRAGFPGMRPVAPGPESVSIVQDTRDAGFPVAVHLLRIAFGHQRKHLPGAPQALEVSATAFKREFPEPHPVDVNDTEPPGTVHLVEKNITR